MDNTNEIYHLLERSGTAAGHPLEGFERTEQIGRAIMQLVEEEPLLSDWLLVRLHKRKESVKEDRVQKLLSGLGNDYTAVYMIDLDTDEFEIIINQKTNNAALEHKRDAWTTYLCNYADKYVLPESCDAMKTTLCHTNILQEFQTKDDFYFRFETIPNSIGQTTFEAHVVKEYGDGHFAVLGFRCVDAIVAKEREYQRKLDRAFKEAQQQLEVISASIPGGLKISYDDPQYTFKYVSKQYAAMLGYDNVEEFLQACGGTIIGIAHPDDVASGVAEALEQYKKGDNYAITYRMKCKDGSWKYIEDHGHKVRTADGQIEHWNLILDKNELVETTIALAAAKKAAEAKTNFLSRMSHDIRTPLNGIIGLLDYDERHADDLAAINANRQKARVAANHLLSLVNDILELNKLDDQNVRLVKEAFNFEDLLHEVQTISEMRAAESGVTVHLETGGPLKAPYVYGSPLHVQQIFINLINNAIKYNKPGGSVWCRVQETMLSPEQVQFTVYVTDTGIGMSEQFLSHVFDPFAQESYDARSVYQGSGLGMSIVKSLVDRMGGTITVQSKVGVGTRETVTLPFQIAQRSDLPRKPDPAAPVDLTGLRVMVVEDNELNMEITKYLLEDEKMSVTEAHDGRQALELFRNSRPGTYDVILMDVMMPVMDGMTAARKIRALERTDAKEIPIFAMTANAFAEDREKSRAAGMNEHLAKPLDSKLLLNKITQYCRPQPVQ